MKTLFLLISLAISTIFIIPSYANSDTESQIALLLDQVITKQLDKHPVWLNLVKYTAVSENNFQSDIVSDEFFLAENGKINPYDELAATLQSFLNRVVSDPDNHAMCKFPARLLWLKSVLELSLGMLPNPQCARLNAWSNFENLQSVSLIMVSGYFGNPASTFGHNLIKLNSNKYNSENNLLDLGINFGAAVPENEPTFIYIMKGLFGGYVGGFSDREFYTQDTLYRETQFRDMWEYELALTDFQKQLFVYHLWEIVGKKYIYYFLKENCGYRVAELLELILGEQVIRQKQPWFLPVDIFHGLNAIDAVEPVTKAIKFIPSSQRLLYADFEKLNIEQANDVNKLIAYGGSFDSSLFDRYSIREKSKIADFLLALYQYKLASYDDNAPQLLKDNKDKALKFRLSLPIDSQENRFIDKVLPPSSGSRASLTKLGVGYNDKEGLFTSFGFAGVHYDILGFQKGSLEHSELKVASIQFGLRESNDLFIDYFDIISIQKMNLNATGLYGEDTASWRVRAGLRRKDLACTDCESVFLEGGKGKVFKLYKQLIGIGMLNIKLETLSEHLSVMPTLGLMYENKGSFKIIAEVGERFDRDNKGGDTLFNLEVRHVFSASNQIRFKLDHHRTTEYKLGLFHYW